jgi:spore coat protein A
VNRRRFLKTSAGAAALLAMQRRAYAFYQSPGLQKFIQPLRTFTSLAPNNLPLAASDGTRPWGAVTATHYTINIGQFQDQLHPALGPTTLWGYFQGEASKRHLGGTILAQKNTPVQLTFVNQLPPTHILPVDTSSLFYNAAIAQNMAAVHLHGGIIPWISDGGPYDWFSPTAVGPSFKNNVIAPGNPPGSAEYYWPNQQSARLMWYHDHAHDITRINAYAGIASAYVLRDPFENNLIAKGVLPSLNTLAEIPLVYQDKVFVGPGILSKDPTWPGPLGVGSLWYPHTYEANSVPPPTMTPPLSGSGRWDQAPSPFNPPPGTPLPLPDPSVIPEMFGDTMLVNGTVYPYLEVQPRRYRFRVLNACNARFLNLQLYQRNLSADGITLAPVGAEIDPNGNAVLAPTNLAGPPMVQIGTEGGFLPAPVILNSPPRPMGFLATGPAPTLGNANRYNLLLAPAERADVVIDFAGLAPDTRLILYSDTPSPFPGGDIRNDYYYGMLDTSLIGGSAGPAAGFGPNTRTLLEIRVVAGPSDPVPFTTWLTQIRTALASRSAELIAPPIAGAARRTITLNETFDQWGRLVQMIGTNVAKYTATPPFFGLFLEDAATEVVNAGFTEVWEIYNLTGDSHPLHFHLVNVQIISRQAFDPAQFPNVVFLGPARLPDLNERGWKETVRMNPAEVTRVVMRFDLPHLPFTLPTSDRATLGLPAPPANKIYHEYIYHCHILEHEEHDMMRPLVVIGPNNP